MNIYPGYLTDWIHRQSKKIKGKNKKNYKTNISRLPLTLFLLTIKLINTFIQGKIIQQKPTEA